MRNRVRDVQARICGGLGWATTQVYPAPDLSSRRWILAVGVVALSLWAERLAERRAYFLTRAEIQADRADDFVKGRVCLREEYDKEGMYPRGSATIT